MRKPTVDLARKLRREMSLPEALLWRELRGEKLGFKVRRQHPIGPYVADFFVREGDLVIEVDGESHGRGEAPTLDWKRDEQFRTRGFRVLRIAAADVLRNLEGVVAMIEERVKTPLHHPADGPPPRAGEDCS